MMKDTNNSTSGVLFVGAIFFFSQWKTGPLSPMKPTYVWCDSL